MKTIEQTKTLDSVIASIEDAARTAERKDRIIDSMVLGEHYRQGDIYLVKIDKLPDGLSPWNNIQITEGATLGSTHTAHNCKVHKPKNYGKAVGVRMVVDGDELLGTYFVGPIIEATERWGNAHAEHCRFDNPPGIFQVCHQSDPRTNRMVAD